MAREASSLIGSGTVEFTSNILTPAQRGINADSRGGHRTGTQVMVGNPEDINSVAAFAASGVIVGTTVVDILSPGNNPLPRMRNVILENVGGQAVLIGHVSNFQDGEAFELGTTAPLSRVEIPLLHNVSIYARTATGTTTIKFIVY